MKIKMMKMRFDAFSRIIKKLKECMRANRRLNKQIREANKFSEKG